MGGEERVGEGEGGRVEEGDGRNDGWGREE